jgi:uncharacterized protein
LREPVYLDSNVFIVPVLYGAGGATVSSRKTESAKKLLASIENGKTVGYTSWLTWDEVIWVVLKTLGRPDALETGQKLLNFPNLRFIDAGEMVISASQHLVDTYELGPRDAIHCSSAISRGLSRIISDDSDLDKVKEIKRIPIQQWE